MITTGPLTAADRAAWEELFRGYLAFYDRTEPPSVYEHAWQRFQTDTQIHALGARLDDELVAIAHFLFHANTSGLDVCLLQDLFTAPQARGSGAATALVTAVSEQAKRHSCRRLYWNTQASNITARRLYDQLAEHRGFVRYEIDL
jgi:GNAT superfamily N-acetyltransferase